METKVSRVAALGTCNMRVIALILPSKLANTSLPSPESVCESWEFSGTGVDSTVVLR